MALCIDAVFVIAVVDGEVDVLCDRAADYDYTFLLYSLGHRLSSNLTAPRACVGGGLIKSDFLDFVGGFAC